MTKPNMKTKASVFSMGQRSEVLSTDLEAPILVPHALEKTSTRVCFKLVWLSAEEGFFNFTDKQILTSTRIILIL